jgi:hypothetical protein
MKAGQRVGGDHDETHHGAGCAITPIKTATAETPKLLDLLSKVD